MTTWVGVIEFDLLLGAVGSLKQKRSVIRPLMADLARHHPVSVAEVDHQDLHRRAVLAVALVSGSHQHLVEVLEQVERSTANRREVELLSARRFVRTIDD